MIIELEVLMKVSLFQEAAPTVHEVGMYVGDRLGGRKTYLPSYAKNWVFSKEKMEEWSRESDVRVWINKLDRTAHIESESTDKGYKNYGVLCKEIEKIFKGY